MAMVAADLANDLKGGLGFGALATSPQTTDLAKGVIDHLKTAVVTHAPGSITGIAPSSGGPLTLGAAFAGTLTLVPSDLEGRFSAAFGVSTPEITAFANAITDHFVLGSINFAIITGICTNTPTSPGPMTDGAGVNGTIAMAPGPALAATVAAGIGQGSVSTPLEAFCTALVDYIVINSEFEYATGTVTAVCPSGGGPITLGAASGATVL